MRRSRKPLWAVYVHRGFESLPLRFSSPNPSSRQGSKRLTCEMCPHDSQRAEARRSTPTGTLTVSSTVSSDPEPEASRHDLSAPAWGNVLRPCDVLEREPDAPGASDVREPELGPACSLRPLLGQSDDDAFRATQEAEPVDVLVLRDLADEFGTVAS